MSYLSSRYLRFALLLAMSVAFAVGVYGDVSGRVEEIQRFVAKTDMFDYEFDVSTSNRSARLRVTARISSGQVEWVLRDPKGDVRLQGWNNAGHSRGDTGEMTPEPGRWTLHVALENATGEYAVKWENK
jgi:hypothetical protein